MNDTKTISDGLEATFGEVIYAYTRKQALADGFQIDASATAIQAGIRYPFYITRAVWDSCVAVPDGVTGQDEAGRLWDVVWMTRFAITRAERCSGRVAVALYIRNTNGSPRLVKLAAECGAVDIDDARAAITLMMPDED